MTQSTGSRDRFSTSRRSSWAQGLAFVGLLAICYAAAYLGQLATTPNIPTWYASLEKPWFNPPNAVFPVVWGILYTLMAVAAWLVWRAQPSHPRTIGLIAFGIQLVLNVAWSWTFFGAQSPTGGLAVIVLLLAAITWTIASFRRVTPGAGWIMLPYLAWVGFATILNIAIVALN